MSVWRVGIDVLVSIGDRRRMLFGDSWLSTGERMGRRITHDHEIAEIVAPLSVRLHELKKCLVRFCVYITRDD